MFLHRLVPLLCLLAPLAHPAPAQTTLPADAKDREFIADLEKAFNVDRNVRSVRDFLNTGALARRAIRLANASPTETQIFQISRALANRDILKSFLDLLDNTGRFTFLREISIDRDRCFIFRLDGTKGLLYLTLAIEHGASGRPVIVDFQVSNVADFQSALIARSSLPPPANATSTAPATAPTTAAALTPLGAMQRATASNDLEAVLHHYDQLEAADRLSSYAQVMRLRATPSKSPEQLAAVDDARKLLPNDAVVATHAFDIYMTGKKYEEAIRAVDTIDATYHDTFLDFLRAQAELGAGQPVQAMKLSRSALSADAKSYHAISVYAHAAAAAQNFAALAAILDYLETQTGIDAAPLVHDPDIAPFRQSPQYPDWQKRHEARAATRHH